MQQSYFSNFLFKFTLKQLLFNYLWSDCLYLSSWFFIEKSTFSFFFCLLYLHNHFFFLLFERFSRLLNFVDRQLIPFVKLISFIVRQLSWHDIIFSLILIVFQIVLRSWFSMHSVFIFKLIKLIMDSLKIVVVMLFL
jgi:hypothetical protein